MDIGVYLPDAIGAQAKAAKLPLSRMLRAAVEEELKKRAADAVAVEAAYRDWNNGSWNSEKNRQTS